MLQIIYQVLLAVNLNDDNVTEHCHTPNSTKLWGCVRVCVNISAVTSQNQPSGGCWGGEYYFNKGLTSSLHDSDDTNLSYTTSR